MKCPNCRLVSPDSAVKCDCGYDFSSGRMMRQHEVKTIAAANQPPKTNQPSRPQELGPRNMAVGACWCIGGIVVTALTYDMAASSPGGGHYIIAWGAILFGAIQFIKGVFQTIGAVILQE